jgi:hypothetical protein
MLALNHLVVTLILCTGYKHSRGPDDVSIKGGFLKDTALVQSSIPGSRHYIRLITVTLLADSTVSVPINYCIGCYD